MLSTLALAQKEKVASFIDTIGVNDEGLNKMNTIRSESVANKNPSYQTSFRTDSDLRDEDSKSFSSGGEDSSKSIEVLK